MQLSENAVAQRRFGGIIAGYVSDREQHRALVAIRLRTTDHHRGLDADGSLGGRFQITRIQAVATLLDERL
ncbi:hypothetical protein D3C84_1118300 [compost metagenome]